jgi:hypothetical protein
MRAFFFGLCVGPQLRQLDQPPLAAMIPTPLTHAPSGPVTPLSSTAFSPLGVSSYRSPSFCT